MSSLLDKAGTYALYANSAGLGLTNTNAFHITAAPATQVAVTTQPPGTVVVGEGFDVKFAVEDATNTVPEHPWRHVERVCRQRRCRLHRPLP